MSKKVKRLYEQFSPSHYRLELCIDADKLTFSGKVVISGQKRGRPSKRLTLHQKKLKVKNVNLVHHGKQESQDIALDRVNSHQKFDELRLHAKEILYPGEYTVTAEFSGNITEQMNGIYPCFFTHNKKKKKLIATQFESHHAREAFPCIDEPEAKATFDLKLTTKKDETVISNMPVKDHVVKNKLQTTSFETTPKMSVYLLAFVIGELGFKEVVTKHGVSIRAYATPDNVAFTEFALEVADKCLEFYNHYFDLPYPLAKCDLIALPDFASGAMENWGCITFREQCLLVDPKHTSLNVKQYVAMVICHELAHQWFGNLVTMRWWTDLWLNEGFASWIEYLAVDHIFPKWHMWTQFITDEQQTALRLDALDNTHAIEAPINHPDEIRTIFDTISYAKGSSVIHMLEQYLGAENFRKGLQVYLKKHAYANTDTIDLWSALEQASHKPVRKFMHTWTSQPGFPIVTADIQDGTLELHQKRFILTDPNPSTTVTWPIPLLSNHEQLADHVLETARGTFPIKKTDTLLINSGRSGFYRIVYDSEYLEHITEAVNSGRLAILDRLGLLSDSFEAAKAGHAPTLDALKLLSAYKSESNGAVWDVMASCIREVRTVMDDEDLREHMKPFIQKLIADQLKRLGWKSHRGEIHLDSLLRPTILSLAASADEPSVIKQAQELFKPSNRKNIEPDLRSVVYLTVARHGDEKIFNTLLELHNDSDNSEERTKLAGALMGFKQPRLIKRALSLIDTDAVRLQDVFYWIVYGFGNRYARDVTWEWLRDHWSWLEHKLGDDLAFARFPLYVAHAFSDKQFMKQYRAFFERVMSPSLERAFKQGIETLQWHIHWKRRDFKAIESYFKDN